MHVIDKPVTVVIYAVARNLARIRPYVGVKILMAPFAAAVHDRNHDPRRPVLAFDLIPSLRQTQAPEFRLVAKSRIIRIYTFPDVRCLRAVNEYRLGIYHARGRSQIASYLFGVSAGAIAHIVRAAQRHQIAPGLWRRLHVIQKRIYALDQVYFVSICSAIEVPQPGCAGFIRNEDIGGELYHYHMVRIFGFGTVLSRSQRRNQDQREQQCCHAPPINFAGNYAHQVTRHLCK